MTRRCGASRPNGRGDCKQPAGARTNHPGAGRCWLHGGTRQTDTSPGVVADRRAVLVDEMSRLGVPITTDPLTGLSDQIAASVGHVSWLRSELEHLVGAEGIDSLTKGVRSVTRRTGKVMAPAGRLVDVDETTKTVGPGVHTLWTLYQQERAHLSRLLVAAVGAGLAERQVALQERHVATLLRLFVAAVNDLGLTEDQRARIPAAVRNHLTIVDELTR